MLITAPEMRLPNTKQKEIVCKTLKEIVLIEPIKAKLVQGVYIRWMVLELKSKKLTHRTHHVLLQNYEKFIVNYCKRKRHIPKMWK